MDEDDEAEEEEEEEEDEDDAANVELEAVLSHKFVSWGDLLQAWVIQKIKIN